MSDPDNPAVPDPEEDDPAAAFAAIGAELRSATVAAVPGWVVRQVVRIAEAWQPGSSAELVDAAERAGRDAAGRIDEELAALFARDPDDQDRGPLEVVRGAVEAPTSVLAAAGVPPVARDDFAVRAFPRDRYDLAPASFADLDPALGEAGIRWGAAKAYVVLARRRAEGRLGPTPPAG